MIGSLSVYRGKKIFVTGHTGFKGSWLISWLHTLGAEIKGYALAPEHSNGIYSVIGGNSLCNSIIADIMDEEKLTSEIVAFKPDFIFHLAAQPLVRLSYKKPVQTFGTNVTGTAHILNAVRSLDNPCSVVIITTDKVYENREWTYPYREVDALGGYDPYSASKACAEIVVSSFRQSFFNAGDFNTHKKAIASARAGNVIGGGDWSDDRIVPDIIRSLTAGKKINVRNPHAIRPWQFVLEPIYGYLLLGSAMSVEPEKFGGAFNFGPYSTDFMPVGQLVENAIRHWGSGEAEFPANENQPHEAGILKLDISKAIDTLNWTPKLSSSEAIEWTINWYKMAKDRCKSYTFDQIAAYHLLQ
ncbi:MAG: CDP-glucose 4,6-dehydratase [Bacteroidota bacterium]